MRWFLATIIALLVSMRPAYAQTQFVEPISELTLLVAASPGGGYDGTAQAIRNTLLSEGLVNQVTIEYSPGAGGLIGLAQFVESEPREELTLLITGRTALGAAVHNRSRISIQDAVPIARLVSPSTTLIVPLRSEIQSVDELAAIINEDAGLISWYGGSVGSFDEIIVREMVSAFSDSGEHVVFNAVPGGGDKIIERLESGDLTVAVSSYEEVSDAARIGRVKILVTSMLGNSDSISLPTFADLGVEIAEIDWRGAFAHPRRSQKDLQRLQALMLTLVQTERWKSELERRYWTDVYLEGSDFAEFIDKDWNLILAKSIETSRDRTQSNKASDILQRRQRAIRLSAAAIFILVVVIAALFLVYRHQRKHWIDTFDEINEAAQLMQKQLDKNHENLASQINVEFEKWSLTDAEMEIAWMLLKGLSFKEIATVRNRSERTVRQQAQSIYAKSKLQSRSDLAAHFLEDFVFGAPQIEDV